MTVVPSSLPLNIFIFVIAVPLVVLVPIYFLHRYFLLAFPAYARPPQPRVDIGINKPGGKVHSITTLNTRLNTNDNGGTGAMWRRERTKRGWVGRTWSDDEEDEPSSPTSPSSPSTTSKDLPSLPPAIVKEYKLVFSKPPNAPLKKCLKAPSTSPSPAPVASTSTLPPPSPTDSDSPSSSLLIKKVRLTEPAAKATLKALREFWASPSVHNGNASGKKNSSSSGGGGIAGYRRTAEIYEMKAKGALGAARKKLHENLDGAETLVDLVDGPDLVKVEEKEDGIRITVISENGGTSGEDSEEEEEFFENTEDDTYTTPSTPSSASHNGGRTLSVARPTYVRRTSSPSATSNGGNGLPHTRSASPSYVIRGLGARTCSPAGMARRRRPLEQKPNTGVTVTPKWIKNKQIDRIVGGRDELEGSGASGSGGDSSSGLDDDEGEDGRDDDEDGFEDVSEGSGTSTPTSSAGHKPISEESVKKILSTSAPPSSTPAKPPSPYNLRSTSPPTSPSKPAVPSKLAHPSPSAISV